MVDINGKLMRIINQSDIPSNGASFQIGTSSLLAGSYFLRVRVNDALVGVHAFTIVR